MSPRIGAGVSFCYYPCPCGWYGDPVKECSCSNMMVSRCQKRISGPLLDRIAIHIEVHSLDSERPPHHVLDELTASSCGAIPAKTSTIIAQVVVENSQFCSIIYAN